MVLFEREIAKAEKRLNFDLRGLVERAANAVPRELASPGEQAERHAFLRQTLPSTEDSEIAFERVLNGNELQPVNYLERGRIAAGAIARIAINDARGRAAGWATGFLVAPRVLLTNNHVFEAASAARFSEAHFAYELDLADRLGEPARFALRPDELFFTSEALDFSVVAVAPASRDGRASLAGYGWLPLLAETGKALEGEWLTIVQHPNGEPKQLCVRENRLLKREQDVLWYSTDTLPGSSGSPVFNNDWFVVALHHSGVPERKNGRIQTVDGTDYDPRTMDELRIKWVANEGIRASRIVNALKAVHPTHPLLQPLYSATPANARIHGRSEHISNFPPAATPDPIKQDVIIMNSQVRTVTVPLTIQLSVNEGALVEASAAGVSVFSEAAKKKKKPKIDAPFDDDYSTRKGFQKNFLGGGALTVHMPKLTPGLLADAVRLIGQPNDYHLHYHNYSVVMHKQRRFAMFSAANVSFANRFEISRPDDVWRVDPRIDVSAQVQNSYYAANNFDRGHLTRNEDLEFGSKPVVALQSAADTCHWTNCTPQHSQFNQNKEIWQGIERHILETSIFNGHFNAMVFTGPVFEEADPEYRKLQYPVKYWKVVAALDDHGKLFATAYIASQAKVIDQHGIEAAVPFGPYKTFQTRIAEIERLTQLEFWSGEGSKKRLSEFDPLRTDAPGRRRRGPRVHEAAMAEEFGADGPYREITDLEEIEL